jgi:O-antigen ligase
MDRRIETSQRLLGAGVILLIALSIIAGGATWQGNAGDAWVILPGIVLLAAAVSSHLLRPRIDWVPLVLVACTLLLPILQTLPWPGAIPPWASVHAAWQFDQARVFGIAPPTALSVAPDATWRSFLAMLPPAAVFLAMLLLSGTALRQIVAVVAGLALLSAAWSLAQVALGDASVPGLHGSSDGQARGFFSNRNHFAALMYIGIALGGAGLVLALRRMLADPEPSRHGPRVIAWAAGFLILVVTCMLAQSRAGVVLGAGVILALFAIILFDTAKASGGSRRIFALVAVAAGLVAVQVGLWGVLDRFKADPFDDGRVIVQATTLGAARDAAPWGTGLGTFRRVYEQREPVETVISAYVNRAHNDWLEFYLEAGWPGLFLLAAWALWWLVATWRVGRSDVDRADPAMRLVRRLAVVALLAVAIHSLVDFPMRTIAISTLVAAMVAVSVSPRGIKRASPASDVRESPIEP